MDEKKHFENPPTSIERITEINEELFQFLQENFKNIKWDKQNLELFLSRPENILLIAKKNGEGAGLLRGHMLPRYDGKGNEILLHEIDVLPDHQRQGIANALIDELKEIASKNNASEIWVITNRSNQGAMALYEKTGGRAKQNDDVVFVYEV